MSASVSVPQPRPVAIPVSETLPWLIGAVVIGLLLYYFVGIDEGATSVFGNSMVVHGGVPETERQETVGMELSFPHGRSLSQCPCDNGPHENEQKTKIHTGGADSRTG